MGITKYAVKRPVPFLLIFLMAAAVGVCVCLGIPREQLPAYEQPVLLVVTPYEGADPKTVEEFVSDEIEQIADSLESVENIRTYSKDDRSMVMLEYQYGTDMEESRAQLEEVLEESLEFLPNGVGESTIIEMRADALPTMRISASSDSEEVLSVLEDGLLEDLNNLPCVADTEIFGGSRNYVRILLEKDKMNLYGLTMDGIAQAMNEMNFRTLLGTLEQGNQTIRVSGSDSLESLQELKKIPLAGNAGSIVRLEDIGEITWASEEAETKSSLDNKDTVTVEIRKTQHAEAEEVSEKIHVLLEEYERENRNLHLNVIYDEAGAVKDSLQMPGLMLLAGILLAMLAAGVLFEDKKAAAAVLVSEVTVLAFALIGMKLMRISLNLITIGTLNVSAAIAAAAAVLVFEECLQEAGARPARAAVKGTREAFAKIKVLLLCLAAAGVSFVIVKGISGKLLFDLGITLVFALAGTAVSAAAAVPALFVALKAERKEERKLRAAAEKLGFWYEIGVRRFMHWKEAAVIIMIIMTLGLGSAALTMERDTVASIPGDTVTVSVNLRPGMQTEAIEKELETLEDLIDDYREVDHYYLKITASKAEFCILMREGSELSASELSEKLAEKAEIYTNKDVRVACSGEVGEFAEANCEKILLKGSDQEDLRESIAELTAGCKEIPGVVMVSSAMDECSARLEVKIDSLRAMNYGMTPAQAMTLLNEQMNGKTVMELVENKKSYPVRLELSDETEMTPEQLMNLTILSPQGVEIAVSEFAELIYTDSQDLIVKENGYYLAELTVSAEASQKANVRKALQELLSQTTVPTTISSVEYQWEALVFEGYKEILKAVVLVIVLIFAAAAFRSDYALLILPGILSGFAGGVLLLLFAGSVWEISSVTGLVLLTGLGAAFALIFAGEIYRLPDEYELQEAVAVGAKKTVPCYLLLASVMLAALFPMALGVGAGSAVMSKMAVVLIGGLLGCIVLIPLLLPEFYLLLFEKKENPEALDSGEEAGLQS